MPWSPSHVTKCHEVWHSVTSPEPPCVVRGCCEAGEDTLSSGPAPSRHHPGLRGVVEAALASTMHTYPCHTQLILLPHPTLQYTTHPHTPSVVSPKVRLKTEHLLASSTQRFVLRKWLSDKIQDLYSNSHKYTVPLNECWDYINAGMHIGDWKDMWGQWVNHHVIYKRSHISKRKLWSHWFVDIIFIGLIKTSYQTLLLPTLFAERKRKEK